MSVRYCKRCKVNVQEQHLYRDERCPLCGDTLPKPVEFKTFPKVKEQKMYDIMVEYIDVTTDQHGSVVYLEVNEEMYNKIKYGANNVVAVHTLTRKDN